MPDADAVGADAGTLARLKDPLRYLMGALYVSAGVLHFLTPQPFDSIVPPQLPAPRALTYLSGAAEITLGLGVLFERTRRPAAVGLMLLLGAVFPANVHMAVNDVEMAGAPRALRDAPDAALWARLPLQAVLVAWAWWYTGEDE